MLLSLKKNSPQVNDRAGCCFKLHWLISLISPFL